MEILVVNGPKTAQASLVHLDAAPLLTDEHPVPRPSSVIPPGAELVNGEGGPNY